MITTGPHAHGELVINVDSANMKSYLPQAVNVPPAPPTPASKTRSRFWVIATTVIILLLIASLGLLINLTINKNSGPAAVPTSHAGHTPTTETRTPIYQKDDDSKAHHVSHDFSTAHLTATFNPYPATDFMGESTLDEDSQVWITSKLDGGFTIHYYLTGLASEESMGAFSILTGTTCTTIGAELGVRGFLHTPMLTALWGKAVGSTSARGSVDVPATGFGIAQVEKHTFVVQEQGGQRIGCGILNFQDHHFDVDHLTATFSPYPESDAKGVATLAPNSQVWMTAKEDGGYTVHYFLTNLPANELSGGIHVHTGTSCAAHAEVQGHYYITAQDPWRSTWTKVEGSTVAFGSVDVANPGFPLEMNDHHAFVVHEESGKRIGCGVLHHVGVSIDRLKEANAELQAQNDAMRALLISSTGN